MTQRKSSKAAASIGLLSAGAAIGFGIHWLLTHKRNAAQHAQSWSVPSWKDITNKCESSLRKLEEQIQHRQSA